MKDAAIGTPALEMPGELGEGCAEQKRHDRVDRKEGAQRLDTLKLNAPVFGKVVSGTDVVDQIERVTTGRKGGHDDVPAEDVVILKAVEIV